MEELLIHLMSKPIDAVREILGHLEDFFKPQLPKWTTFSSMQHPTRSYETIYLQQNRYIKLHNMPVKLF